MLLVALVAGLSMAARDIAGTVTIRMVDAGRGGWAGLFDALGDIAAVLSVGVAGGETVLHGVSAATVIVIGATCAGGFAGTSIGTVLGSRFERSLETRAHTQPASHQSRLERNP